MTKPDLAQPRDDHRAGFRRARPDHDRDPRRGARGDRGGARPARPRPGARRRAAARRQLAGQPVAEEGRAAVVPAQPDGDHQGRPAATRSGGTRSPSKFSRLERRRFREGRLPRRAVGDRAPLGLCRAGRRADAVLRQSRRLCRQRHDGRHLGVGRLLRADRQERASFRRRRHRRRARADAGRPDHHRGQLLHRRALRGGRGLHRARRLGARHGRVHRQVDQDRRPRHRRGLLRRGAGLFGRGRRHAAGQAVAQRRAGPQPLLRGDRQAGRRAGPGRRPRSTNC